MARELDAVDQYIVEHVEPHDLVITADLPLAAAVVDKHALALNPWGVSIRQTDNVHERLPVRNLMQHLRSGGLVLGGPAPLSPMDRQRFAAALDRASTRLRKESQPSDA